MSNSENVSAKDNIVQTANIKITDIYRKLFSFPLSLSAGMSGKFFIGFTLNMHYP